MPGLMDSIFFEKLAIYLVIFFLFKFFVEVAMGERSMWQDI